LKIKLKFEKTQRKNETGKQKDEIFMFLSFSLFSLLQARSQKTENGGWQISSYTYGADVIHIWTVQLDRLSSLKRG